MKVVVGAGGEIISNHLPPVEQSSLLEITKDRRVRALDKIDTPVDEYGVPEPHRYLESLAETLDPDYLPPNTTNIHHLVHPRQRYHASGRDSVQYKYRESPTVMLEMAQQLHNYGHWVMLPPEMPAYEVMEQRVKEQNQINTLFKLGRAVIAAPRWLDDMFGNGAQSYQVAEAYVETHEPSEAIFYDYLDSCQDGQLGLMPDKQGLADMGIPAATRYLGVLAGARALSFKRESRDIMQRQSTS